MPFKKGQSGNPAGRPKGAKHKLNASFLKDFHEVWERSGKAAIEHLAENDQAALVKVAAQLVPRDYNVNHNDFSEESYEELQAALQAELASLAELGISAESLGLGTSDKTTH